MTSSYPIKALACQALVSMSALLLFPIDSNADVPSISLDSFMNETQRASENPDRLDLVWWIPLEYWEITMAMEPAPSTPEQIEAFTSALRDYTLFAVADGNIGPFGGITWISKEDLRASIVLQDYTGTRYVPLTEEQLSPDARNLSATFRPVMASILGPMGEHMEFFFFPATSESGLPIADAKSEGMFQFQLAEDTHEWRLPLGSLLPSKICPIDGEELNGAWKYCPWHGEELREGTELIAAQQ